VTLDDLDSISQNIPFTHPRACRLLHRLVSTFEKPNIVEVACCYGKATLYLAAAVKQQGGIVHCVDAEPWLWEGKSVIDRLRDADLLDVCEVTLGCDARWYMLDLFRRSPDQWIDLAYIDAAHCVEVDSFVSLAAWTHLRPGGIIVFDDLDWIPLVEGAKGFSRPQVSHVRAIFEYISALPDVGEKALWGRQELEWTWGFIRKRKGVTGLEPSLEAVLRTCDETPLRSR
jgi:predicted O-methyltransferase YrrM